MIMETQEVGWVPVGNLKDGLLGLRRGTVLALPSVSYRLLASSESVGTRHLEERMLFLLLLLRNPEVRIVYVTSFPIRLEVLRYYFGLLGDDGAASDRLVMLSLDDPRPRTLSSKLMGNPRALARVKALLHNDRDAFLLPFRGTAWDVLLADELGILPYCPAPRALYFGTKSGARRAAKLIGLPVVCGREHLESPEAVEEAVRLLEIERPDAEAFVIKLNDGIGGQGNVILERGSIRSPIQSSNGVFCALYETWPTYSQAVLEQGAVVEELIRSSRLSSPSVQLEITPSGAVHVLSTHEQVLGGPDFQVYRGCKFPARPQFRDTIQTFGERLSRLLAAGGVIGMVSVDLLAVPVAGGAQFYVCEINLRMGGTTFAQFATALATGANYDRSSAELRARGSPKFYSASEDVISHGFVGLRPSQVINALEHRGLAYCGEKGVGTILSLLGALEPYGRIGLTCIGSSIAEADLIYEETLAVIRSLSRASRTRLVS